MLVNKLGHPNNKFVNKVCGYLIQLCRRQPNMRPVIVREVEYLIFRKFVFEWKNILDYSYFINKNGASRYLRYFGPFFRVSNSGMWHVAHNFTRFRSCRKFK